MYKVKVRHDIFSSKVTVYRKLDWYFFSFWFPIDGASARSAGDHHQMIVNDFADKFCNKYNCHNN